MNKLFLICLCFASLLVYGQNEQDSNTKKFEKGYDMLNQTKSDETDSITNPHLNNSTDNKTPPYKKETVPQYPGGDNARIIFLVSNIKYPEIAIKKHKQGIVYVSFIVEKDGSLSHIRILNGISDEIDEEALRVVKSMPKWIPGTRNGESARVLMNLPINFILQKKH
jgi:TonB family protein